MIYVYAEYDLRNTDMMPHAVTRAFEVPIRGTLIFTKPALAYVFEIDRSKLTDDDVDYLHDGLTGVCDLIAYDNLTDAFNDETPNPRILCN